MYPLKFEPIYKEKIWGGSSLAEKFNRKLPSKSIGESWEIAAHENGCSKIANGRLKGKTLLEAIEDEGEEILGRLAKEEWYNKFPLLIKILDANDKLSVQVHPDDDYALKYENGELGKAEMWYIIDAKKDSKLIFGVKDEVNKDEFLKAIENDNLKEKLVEVNVNPGDVFYIPAGTVHTIQEGILLAEIQQNSDTTYRVYDWNRPGQDGKLRELHVKKAVDVIDFNRGQIGKVTGLKIENKTYIRNILVACPYFIVDILTLKDSFIDNLKGDRFYILQLINGEADLIYQDGIINLEAGQTVLLPAGLGKYEIKGEAKLIRSYIRDLNNLKRELNSAGYPKEEIIKIAGLE